MNDNTYGLLCAIILGLGQMCMFTGYDTQSFIVEPVLHSVHDRRPGDIDAHAGYYGQSVSMIVYMFANLLAPSVLQVIGPKWSLVIGSSLFTLYLCSFFYVHYFFFYGSAALMGIGFALYYTGNGGYVTEHSTRETIERNSALTWAVGTSCMILGGVVMLFTIQPPPQEGVFDSNLDSTLSLANATTTAHRGFREYDDWEIRLMYGAFVLVSFCSNLIFFLIPQRPVHNCLANIGKAESEKKSFTQQIMRTIKALGEPEMIQLAPVFCVVGTTTSFWIAAYPTTFNFTRKLSSYIYLPAYYSIILGAADMIMGFIISDMSKRYKNFGQKPTQLIGVTLYLSAMMLVVISTPAWSTNTPNDDPTWILEPSMYLCLIIALLFGLADNCLNTSRTILCALVLPSKRAQVFSLSKFYQARLLLSLSACVLMFLSPWLSVPVYFMIILINCLLSVYFFNKVANNQRHIERKITMATTEAAMVGMPAAPIRTELESSVLSSSLPQDFPAFDDVPIRRK